ncbi:MAG TPA: MAPEG family protein [Verrucomicrobiae bacterium]|nr:MAPEG family protein [Verrucomicrobiae bacterium]
MPESPGARARLLAVCALGPISMLVMAVGRLGNHRFHTPEDIAGSGLTAGTNKAKLLQALLQNTLEQLCIALPVYSAWALLAPPRLMVALPTAAILFVVGRVLFFWGYAKGAPGRAIGFGLTFYPSILMLAGCFYFAAALVGT